MHDSLIVPTPPNPRSDAIRHNLPLELTRFVGRHQAIVELRQLLRGNEIRLLTLTGSGGSGKTRLALRVATELIGDFPDGVWLAELAAVADPALVARALAATLGIREQADQPLGQTIAVALAPKQLLLVLDNCEHLAQACADLAETLLRSCPNLKILATSREPLRVSGEVTWLVPPLALPPRDIRLPLDTLAQIEAVALFVERARARQSTFTLTHANALAVVAICHCLEGLPLALEFAAAQIMALPPEQLAARLSDALHLLGGGSRTVARQETLRATLDWSHALLTTSERAVFRRLAVFRGGFTLEAAESVAAEAGGDPTEVCRVLTSLVDKSLVVALTQDSTPRFRLLEPVRQYAEDQLQASGEEEIIRRRHAQEFLALAEAVAPKLLTGGRGPWLARLETEHDNLRTALTWTFRERAAEDRTLGMRLVAALGHFWFFRGYFSEGISWITRAIADCPQTHPEDAQRKAKLGVAESPRETAARATALCIGGELAWMLFGPSALSRQWLAESVSLWRTLGDDQGLAYALQAAATVDPDNDHAEEYVQESLELHRARGDRPGMAWALHAAGLLALQCADWATARARLTEALELYREGGDDWFAAQALNNLGDIARIQGDHGRAAALYQESLALFRSQGMRAALPSVLQNLGYLALQAGDARRARALFRESLAMFRDQVDQRGTAESLAGLAGALAGLKQPARAAQLFGTAEALLEASGAERWPANRSDYERAVALARDQLSASDFAAAWATGRALAPDQAIADVLSEDLALDPKVIGGTDAPKPSAGLALTPRERAVARLVAQGRTNRQIAEELIITPGTATLHVKNILRKLGFSSRAQIAVWAVERGLVTRPDDTRD